MAVTGIVPLRLRRRDAQKGLMIAGTDLGLIALIPANPKPDWTLVGYSTTARLWMSRAGLATVRFVRRSDLLSAVAAQHASDPIPAAEEWDIPTLRRTGRGVYSTGDFEITRTDEHDRRRTQHRWKIAQIRPDGHRCHCGCAGTLQEAAYVIRRLRRGELILR